MGRWSFLEFEGKEARRIIIATGYHFCDQTTKLGSSTYHDQQYHILLQQGQLTPNPRQQFIDNIIHQIKEWRQQNKAVLFCLDANDNVVNPNPVKGIGHIIAETDLMDLHCLQHLTILGPPTYN